MAQRNSKTVTDNNTIHVPLSDEQKKKLKALAEADRRKMTDFIRLLIEEEWTRKKVEAIV